MKSPESSRSRRNSRKSTRRKSSGAQSQNLRAPAEIPTASPYPWSPFLMDDGTLAPPYELRPRENSRIEADPGESIK
jgi:hypothetical protein